MPAVSSRKSARAAAEQLARLHPSCLRAQTAAASKFVAGLERIPPLFTDASK